jgi:hypothetical protein
MLAFMGKAGYNKAVDGAHLTKRTQKPLKRPKISENQDIFL